MMPTRGRACRLLVDKVAVVAMVLKPFTTEAQRHWDSHFQKTGLAPCLDVSVVQSLVSSCSVQKRCPVLRMNTSSRLGL